MNIGELKKEEMQEIIDFYYQIEEYGHIYHYPPEKLEEPFQKILAGISEIRKLMDDSYLSINNGIDVVAELERILVQKNQIGRFRQRLREIKEKIKEKNESIRTNYSTN